MFNLTEIFNIFQCDKIRKSSNNLIKHYMPHLRTVYLESCESELIINYISSILENFKV